MTANSRLLRASVLGGVAMTLATAAHLLGGGRLPAAGVLLFLTVVTGTVAVLVTARRCSFPTLLGVLGVLQLGLHLIFEAGALCSLDTTAPGSAGMSTAAMAGAGSSCTTASGAALGHAMAGPPEHTGHMLTAHLLATVLTALLLSHGEDLLWGLASRAVVAGDAVPGGWPSTTAVPVPGTLTPATRRPETDDAAPRGPPARAAVHS